MACNCSTRIKTMIVATPITVLVLMKKYDSNRFSTILYYSSLTAETAEVSIVLCYVNVSVTVTCIMNLPRHR